MGPSARSGPIPLRPLGVGDVLSAAVGVTRRHWRSIGVVAAAVALLASAANLATLAATDSLAAYAATTWIDDMIAGRSTLPPTGILLAMLATVLVSAIGSVITAGVASAYAGADALGRTDRPVAADRMRGRWKGLPRHRSSSGFPLPLWRFVARASISASELALGGWRSASKPSIARNADATITRRSSDSPGLLE